MTMILEVCPKRRDVSLSTCSSSCLPAAVICKQRDRSREVREDRCPSSLSPISVMLQHQDRSREVRDGQLPELLEARIRDRGWPAR